MNSHFSISYNNIAIEVAGGDLNNYVLKYPDGKFILLDRNETGWVVEDRSGDYWTDEDIAAIGELINKNEPEQKTTPDDEA